MKDEDFCSRNPSPQTSSKCWGERLGLPEGRTAGLSSRGQEFPREVPFSNIIQVLRISNNGPETASRPSLLMMMSWEAY